MDISAPIARRGRLRPVRHGTILLLAGLVLGVACTRAPASDPGTEDRALDDAELGTGDAVAGTIATVLGRAVMTEEREALRGLVLVTLLDDFAARNEIEPTDAEIEAFHRGAAAQERAHRAEGETFEALQATGETSEPAGAADDDMARELVRAWKINQALYARHGGRVVFQQFGAEPLDAYRAFLEAQAKQKRFEIFDPRDEAEFWTYFTDDALHVFFEEAEGRRMIETPWWLMSPE